MNDPTQSRWLPVVLPACPDIFMTFAVAFGIMQMTNLMRQNW